MEWADDGIILGTRRHGETSLIVEALTPGHGRHLGIVKGGRSRRMRGTLQPGNLVHLVWRARLEDHLGTYQIEPLEDRAAELIENRTVLAGFMTIAAHVRLLPERDPGPDLFEHFAATYDMLPGVLGDDASSEEDSFGTGLHDGQAARAQVVAGVPVADGSQQQPRQAQAAGLTQNHEVGDVAVSRCSPVPGKRINGALANRI